MAQINVILWDVDGTLLDFSAAERRALEDCFRSWATRVPLVTAYCRTRPFSRATREPASSRNTTVSPRSSWYSWLKAGMSRQFSPSWAKNSSKRPSRTWGLVSSPRSSRRQ